MTRLYITQTMGQEQIIELTKDQRHYLEKVLRYEQGQHFLGFNEQVGEWKIVFEKPQYRCIEQIRKPLPSKPLWLAFSPIKNDPMNFLIEKATELGVTDLQPILCQRTNSHRVNLEKLVKNAQEAAQQCERLDVPIVHDVMPLTTFLDKLPNTVHWYAALERSDNKLEMQFPAGFIIGPEGGWTDNERTQLQKHAKSISLGKNILRAETAAIVCLSSHIFK